MGNGDDDADRMVDNPEYQELVAFKKTVSGERSTVAHALKAAASSMQNGSAWTGPTTATNFSTEISERDRHLSTLVGDVLDAIDDRMKEVPKKVPRHIGPGRVPTPMY